VTELKAIPVVRPDPIGSLIIDQDLPLAMSALKEQQGASCTVCYERFSPIVPVRQPRLLSCGHTFCTECMGRLPQQQQRVIRYCTAYVCMCINEWQVPCVRIRLRPKLLLLLKTM